MRQRDAPEGLVVEIVEAQGVGQRGRRPVDAGSRVRRVDRPEAEIVGERRDALPPAQPHQHLPQLLGAGGIEDHVQRRRSHEAAFVGGEAAPSESLANLEHK